MDATTAERPDVDDSWPAGAANIPSRGEETHHFADNPCQIMRLIPANGPAAECPDRVQSCSPSGQPMTVPMYDKTPSGLLLTAATVLAAVADIIGCPCRDDDAESALDAMSVAVHRLFGRRDRRRAFDVLAPDSCSSSMMPSRIFL